MSSFFIDRPVFAWVIAILIALAGMISITQLGVESYPSIAPPQVAISATYQGADANTVAKTVTQVIEQQLTGIDHLMYFSSSSNADGTMTITLTFEPGTNPDIAQVQTQNKVSLATPRLPAEVTAQGVTVLKTNPDFLMFFMLKSEDGSMNSYQLNNLLSQSIIDGLSAAASTYTGLTVQTSLNPFNSDHVPFIEKGVPAVLTIEGTDDANHAIHTASDTLDRLNFDLALEILRMNTAFVAQALMRA